MVQKGSKIGLFSASGNFDKEKLNAGIAVLERWGLEIVHTPIEPWRYFAGSDQDRKQQLENLLDSELEVFWAIRGGYGFTKIVDALLPKIETVSNKTIIGFSDLTPLINVLSNKNLCLHAPMVAQLGKCTAESLDSLWTTLFTGVPPDITGPKTESNVNGAANGVVVGGNVCMLCDSIGTLTELDTAGKILFLEEVGEPFYRLERMMTQLSRAGKFDNIKGVVLGQFTDCEDVNNQFSISSSALVSKFFEHLNVPVASEIKVGHEYSSLTLPIGQHCALQVGEQGSHLSFRV